MARFKIGDRVVVARNCATDFVGRIGTVTGLKSSGTYTVQFDAPPVRRSGVTHGGLWSDRSLEPYDPSGDLRELQGRLERSEQIEDALRAQLDRLQAVHAYAFGLLTIEQRQRVEGFEDALRDYI